MDKTNLELFQQALNEGLSNRFDSLAEEYTGEIVCSRKHKLAMRTIVYGKAGGARAWSPRMRRVVAILVAAALLLTSCGIIFREEIREVFDELFVNLNYGDHGQEGKIIEEIYTLGYIPEGYVLEKENFGDRTIQYIYINNQDQAIIFYQNILESFEYVIDSENGYSEMVNENEYTIYYRFNKERHYYIWSDEKYVMNLSSDREISDEELILIIRGIITNTVKKP